MKMKMSTGAKVALGLGALVILYLVMKNSGSSAAAAAAPPSGSNLALPSIHRSAMQG